MTPGAGTLVSGAAVSDAALVTATRAGHEEAFLLLYDRHRDLAWRVARSVATNDVDAEDAVSEAFSRIFWVVREREVESFRSYLAATVRNAATDLHRRRERPAGEAALAEPPSTAPGVEEQALDHGDSSLVARAFASLPERHRSALWLSEVEGFTTAEVGHVVGTSANGAAALAMRARECLREAYLGLHLRRPLDPECREVTEQLATFVRGNAAARVGRRVEAHVSGCAACERRLTEVRSLNESLAALVPATPLALLAGDRVLERTRQAAPSSANGAGDGVVARIGDSAQVWIDAGARLGAMSPAAASFGERVLQPVVAAVAGLLIAGAAVGASSPFGSGGEARAEAQVDTRAASPNVVAAGESGAAAVIGLLDGVEGRNAAGAFDSGEPGATGSSPGGGGSSASGAPGDVPTPDDLGLPVPAGASEATVVAEKTSQQTVAAVGAASGEGQRSLKRVVDDVESNLASTTPPPPPSPPKAMPTPAPAPGTGAPAEGNLVVRPPELAAPVPPVLEEPSSPTPVAVLAPTGL